MSNHPFTSIIPPGAPVPDPPEFELFKKVGAGCFAVVMLLIIGFVLLDFSFDITGNPLKFGSKEPVPLPQEGIEAGKIRRGTAENVKNVLEQTVLVSPVRQCRIKCRSGAAGDKVAVVPFLTKWDTDRGERDAEPPFSLNLFADGMPVEWNALFGKTLFFAAVKLPPGLHRLGTAVHEVEVYVEGEGTSEQQKAQIVKYPNWSEFRFHTGTDDAAHCGECHNSKDDANALKGRNRYAPLGEWKGGRYCAECHKDLNFQSSHKHTVEIYKDCRKCHSVHGTTSPEGHLLRDSRPVLCVQCHEPRMKK